MQQKIIIAFQNFLSHFLYTFIHTAELLRESLMKHIFWFATACSEANNIRARKFLPLGERKCRRGLNLEGEVDGLLI